jgi:hypothetical protein
MRGQIQSVSDYPSSLPGQVLRPAQARPFTTIQTRAGATQGTVVMNEFRFILSPHSVRTGAATFALVDRRPSPAGLQDRR